MSDLKAAVEAAKELVPPLQLYDFTALLLLMMGAVIVSMFLGGINERH